MSPATWSSISSLYRFAFIHELHPSVAVLLNPSQPFPAAIEILAATIFLTRERGFRRRACLHNRFWCIAAITPPVRRSQYFNTPTPEKSPTQTHGTCQHYPSGGPRTTPTSPTARTRTCKCGHCPRQHPRACQQTRGLLCPCTHTTPLRKGRT